MRTRIIHIKLHTTVPESIDDAELHQLLTNALDYSTALEALETALDTDVETYQIEITGEDTPCD